MTRPDVRVVLRFLVLTFAISWGGMTAFYFADVDPGSSAGQGVGTIIFMGAPAIAAITLLRFRRAAVREGVGLYLGRIRWIALAWIAPVG
jgi:pimeloyl-ACP methyl ester carboxylesterase